MESKDEAGPGPKIPKGRARVGREFPDATMHGKHRRASMNLERSQLNGPGRSLLPRHGRFESFQWARFEGVPSLCGMDICGVLISGLAKPTPPLPRPTPPYLLDQPPPKA
jgi:hypothetical protein